MKHNYTTTIYRCRLSMFLLIGQMVILWKFYCNFEIYIYQLLAHISRIVYIYIYIYVQSADVRFAVQQLISTARNEHGLIREHTSAQTTTRVVGMLNAICYPYISIECSTARRNLGAYIYIYIYL